MAVFIEKFLHRGDRLRGDRLPSIETELIPPPIPVYNEEPFINTILDASSVPLYPEELKDICEEMKYLDSPTINVSQTRKIDVSGFVPNLLGSCETSADAREILSSIGKELLDRLSWRGAGVQDEVNTALLGGMVTPGALVEADMSQVLALGELYRYREKSPLALAVKKANESALIQLYKHPELLHSDYDQYIRDDARQVLYQGKPRVCYVYNVYPDGPKEGGVRNIWHYFFVADIMHVVLPEKFGPHTVGELLTHITPDEFRRVPGEDKKFNPKDPLGLIGLLGKISLSWAQHISDLLKKLENPESLKDPIGVLFDYHQKMTIQRDAMIDVRRKLQIHRRY